MDAFDIIRGTMTEFSEVSDENVKIFIYMAESLVSQKRFKSKYPMALAYLAAHKMKLSGLGKSYAIGSVGDTIGLSSVSEGKTSVSFSNSQDGNTNSDAEFGLTVYGMQFLELRRSCIITIVSAGVNYER